MPIDEKFLLRRIDRNAVLLARRLDRVETRLAEKIDQLEAFKNRLLGMAVLAGVFSGVLAALVHKAIT